MFIIASFYHFFDFADYKAAQKPLLAELTRLGIKGSILIAPEGINGTISGSREAIDACMKYLHTHIAEFEHKESNADRQPFVRAKVRLKKEIISMGEPPSKGLGRGTAVNSKEWNTLLEDPGVTVLDARNSYEVHLGTFKRAIDPGIRTFRQLPHFVRKTLDPKEHKKIATFCTGGIRCEKFSAWLLEQGFAEVYQLKGGILKYLEETPPAASRWQGECYVFDERVAVSHDLSPSPTATMCPACGHALTEADREHATHVEGKSCRFCA